MIGYYYGKMRIKKKKKLRTQRFRWKTLDGKNHG